MMPPPPSEIKRSPVALVACPTYGQVQCMDAVREGVSLLGGLSAFLSPGMRVVVKPNLLSAASPDRAVCTHPDVLYAVCRLITEFGCTVTVADSPGVGAPYRPESLERVYDTAGYTAWANDLGVILNLDTSSVPVRNPSGHLIHSFSLIRPVVEADAVVVVSKAKTHTLTTLTAATKNIFGTVPGREKTLFHARFPDPFMFAALLLDLNRCVKPCLQVVDAVEVMEGDGPMGGDPAHLGAVIVGADPTAVDVVVARLMGIDPHAVPTISVAVAQGLIDAGLTRAEVLGADPASLARHDIRLANTHWSLSYARPGSTLCWLFKRIGGGLSPHPVFAKQTCTRCGRCVRSCPVGAIKLGLDGISFKKSRCIRCYCCHEMCESRAIHLEDGLLRLIIRYFT